MRANRRAGGLSLIEILIALAIFLVGILAVLRIFPLGLGTIGRTSDRQDALRLGESSVSALLAQENRLPDYILPAGRPTDTSPGDLAGGNPNPGFGFLRLLTGTDQYRPYDLDLPFTDPNGGSTLHRLLANDRLVVGEQVVVGRRMIPDTAGGGTQMVAAAQPYHTVFGPMALTPGNQAADVAVFRDFDRTDATDLRQTVATIGGNQVYQDRPVFAVIDGGIDDFTGAAAPDKLLFELDSTDRLFSVRCGYRDADGNVRWAQLAPVFVAAAPVPSDKLVAEVPLVLPATGNPPITDVLPESVQVRQVLTRDTGSGGLPRFSYRDVLLARTAPDVPIDPGLLYFSPNLAGEHLSLEYVVADWRNLSETATLQVDAAGQITNLAQNNSLFGVQVQARNLDETWVPIVKVLSTGALIPVDAAAWTADPGLARQGFVPVDPASTLDPVAGPQDVVIFFRKFGNWQVAPSIAPFDYLMTQDAMGMSSSGNAVDYPVQSLLVDVQPGPTVGTDQYTELWFRASEAGRAVAVTYEVNVGSRRELVSGELHVIPPRPNRQSAGGVPPDRFGIVLSRPNVATDASTTPRPLIHAVQGRSLRLRVAYDEDITGRPAVPVRTPVAPGTEYQTAEQMIELGTYVRRER